MNEFTITKRIAKHGRESVIVVPSVLRELIPAGSLAKITIQLLEKPNKEEEHGNQ